MDDEHSDDFGGLVTSADPDDAVDVDRAAADPVALVRALRLPHHRVGELLGPHVFHATSSVDVAVAGGEGVGAPAEKLDVTARIEQKMNEAEVPFVLVEGRVKRLYSIWKKLRAQKISLDQVYDLVAARIITPNEIRHCYAALGVVHNNWKPVPGRIKDWIATPRDNLYQSLHTSVIGSNLQSFEVQIRTEEMHRRAEAGIFAYLTN